MSYSYIQIRITRTTYDLLTEREELLRQLAPVLRRVNPYSKERSKRERANTLKRKALKERIAEIEREVTIEIIRQTKLRSNDLRRKTHLQRERRHSRAVQQVVEAWD